MNNKKALFFDIDGTLASGGKVSPALVEVLAKLSKKTDIDLYVSTGRSIGSIHVIKEILPYFKGMNLANGGHITIDNKMVMFDTFTPEVVKKVVKVLNKNNISYGVITYEHDYWVFHSDEVRKQFEELESPRYLELSYDDTRWHQECIQFWILATNDELQVLEKQIPDLKFFFWRTYGADVVPAKRSKGTGIEYICFLEDYDYENTYAFGDSHNDIPMLEKVKHGIAMGNSTDDLKAIAEEVIGSIKEDGLVKYLKRFL